MDYASKNEIQWLFQGGLILLLAYMLNAVFLFYKNLKQKEFTDLVQ